jgi:hypothetical protein
MAHINFEKDFQELVELSQLDLSAAHVLQHSRGAQGSADIAGINTSGPGAYSSGKQLDTVEIHNEKLTGKKFWLSNLPNVSWLVIVVGTQVVYAELDSSVKIEMVPILGMQDTQTGHVLFDQTRCRIICDLEDDAYFFVRRAHSIRFIANHMGLCQALFNDIDTFTIKQQINCDYHKQKLKLQLDVMQLIWNQLPKSLGMEHRDHYYWQQKNTTYAFAKKCLIETCQFMTEITGSGLYQLGSQANQRYQDALIYSSHMQNLYAALKN